VLELNYHNDYITISGTYDKNILDIITEECSYFVPSADWSEKYQSGYWDGKISLFKKKTMSFPAGLLDNVSQSLEGNNIVYKIIDSRPLPKIKKNCIVDLGDNIFRDYQNEAKYTMFERQRGILALCTGAGKTKLSAGIISDISVYPVLFVVPSVSLLKQTAKEFNISLKPLCKNFSIGALGGGEFNPSDDGVNVATYHTLLTAYNQKYSEQKKKVIDIEDDKTSLESLNKQLKILTVDLNNSPSSKTKAISKKIKLIESKIENKKQQFENKAYIRKIVENTQLLIIDETHIAAEVIEYISLKCKNAYYKCGLSATPQRMDNQEKRMFGATGPIIMRVTASELIRKKYLVKPCIYIIDLDFIDKTSATYQETYKNAIVLNQPRNELIKDFAESMKAQGRPTLILVERLEHGKLLESMIDNCLFVPGKDGIDDSPISDEELDYRRLQLNKLERNEIIMVATSWAFTGLDAPKLGCLILGCSISSPITTIQQIGRALRMADGKEDCVVIDFKMKEKSLRNHSNARLRAYKTEEEFLIKTVKINKRTNSYEIYN
jgi:superfamily II DNA or RNA helicase